MDQNNYNNGFNDQNNFNNDFENQNNSSENINDEQFDAQKVVSSYNVYYNKNPKPIIFAGIVIFFLAGAFITGVEMFLNVETTKMVEGYTNQTMVRAFKEELNKVYISAQNQYLTESVSGEILAFELSVDDTHKCYIYDLDSLGLAGINKASAYYGTAALCFNNETNMMDKIGIALCNDKYHTDGFVLMSSNLSDDVVKEGSSIDSVVYLKDRMTESDMDRLTNDLSILIK